MADRYFVGDANGNWVNANNWAISGGGVGGAGFPTASDSALFDTSSPDCLIDFGIDCGNIQLLSDFTNTLTQKAGKTISTDYISQLAGTFVGSDANITLTDEGVESVIVLNLSGGNFTSTSGSLSIKGNILIDSTTTFDHNNGTTTISDASFDKYYTIDDAEFFDVTMSIGSKKVYVNGTFCVAGDLTLTNTGTFETGAFVVKGDVDAQDSAISTNATTTFTFAGSGDQLLHSTNNPGSLPSLHINKPSGTLTCTNTMNIYGDIIHTAGDTDFSASIVAIQSSYIKTLDAAAIMFNDFFFDTSANNTTIVSNLCVGGDLTLEFGRQINGGNIQAYGDVFSTSDNVFGGTTTLEFAGSVDQTITESLGRGWMGGTFIVNKPSGILRLGADLNIDGTSQDLTLTQGTMCTNGFDLVVTDEININGSSVLQRVTGDTITYSTLNGTISDVTVCAEPAGGGNNNGFFAFF